MHQEYILYDSEEKEEKVAKSTEQDEEQYQDQCGPISFAKMGQQNMKKTNLVAGSQHNKYLRVSPGVNLRGKCCNPLCKGKDGSWYSLGFGNFLINAEVAKGKCRQCGQKITTKTVVTLGFTRAIVEFQGLMVEDCNDNQVEFKKTYEQRNGKFNYFQGNSDGNLANWQYLNVTCKPI